jgi:hypothetical protein
MSRNAAILISGKLTQDFHLTAFAGLFGKMLGYSLAHISTQRVISIQIGFVFACGNSKIGRATLPHASEAINSLSIPR